MVAQSPAFVMVRTLRGCDTGPVDLGAGGPILSVVTVGSLVGKLGAPQLVLAPPGPWERRRRCGSGAGPHSPDTPPRGLSLAHVSLQAPEAGPLHGPVSSLSHWGCLPPACVQPFHEGGPSAD